MIGDSSATTLENRVNELERTVATLLQRIETLESPSSSNGGAASSSAPSLNVSSLLAQKVAQVKEGLVINDILPAISSAIREGKRSVFIKGESFTPHELALLLNKGCSQYKVVYKREPCDCDYGCSYCNTKPILGMTISW